MTQDFWCHAGGNLPQSLYMQELCVQHAASEVIAKANHDCPSMQLANDDWRLLSLAWHCAAHAALE